MTDKFNEITNSEEFKKALPYLLAGGLGAGAGALVTGGRNTRKDESRVSHVGRVLRNALLTGGLAAGGTALVNAGLDNTVRAVDKDNFSTGGPGNEGPLSTGLKDALFSPASAVGAGGLGLALTHNAKSMGAGREGMANNANLLRQRLGMSEADFAPKTSADIDAAIRSKATPSFKGAPFAPPVPDKQVLDELMRLRRGAGMIGGDTQLKRIISAVTRRGPLSTLGQTTGRRFGRGALGLTAAAIPALAGALLTNDTRPE
jgi:hypothetical protein